jgi:hypothetical protein
MERKLNRILHKFKFLYLNILKTSHHFLKYLSSWINLFQLCKSCNYLFKIILQMSNKYMLSLNNYKSLYLIKGKVFLVFLKYESNVSLSGISSWFQLSIEARASERRESIQDSYSGRIVFLSLQLKIYFWITGLFYDTSLAMSRRNSYDTSEYDTSECDDCVLGTERWECKTGAQVQGGTGPEQVSWEGPKGAKSWHQAQGASRQVQITRTILPLKTQVTGKRTFGQFVT